MQNSCDFCLDQMLHVYAKLGVFSVKPMKRQYLTRLYLDSILKPDVSCTAEFEKQGKDTLKLFYF